MGVGEGLEGRGIIMSQQELESLARRLDAEARKHTGDLQADLVLAAKVVREAAKVVELMEGV